MSKITRRSYKRKKILMGAALFGAVGLVSTGFAAWVLSASASNTQNPNLKAGTVSDKSMSFEGVKIYGLDTTPGSDKLGTEIEIANYSFNPRHNDGNGRVRFGSNDGADDGERLSLTVKGTVKEAQNLGSLKVSFDSIPASLQSAVTKGYVVLPACASAAQDVSYTLSGEASKTAAFEYEIAFTWGATFGGVNPADYYDEAGSAVAMDTVKTTLEDLHTLLDNVQLSVTFVAEPN